MTDSVFFSPGGLSLSVLEAEAENQWQPTAGDVKARRGGQPGPAGAGRALQASETLHASATRPGEGE